MKEYAMESIIGRINNMRKSAGEQKLHGIFAEDKKFKVLVQ